MVPDGRRYFGPPITRDQRRRVYQFPVTWLYSRNLRSASRIQTPEIRGSGHRRRLRTKPPVRRTLRVRDARRSDVIKVSSGHKDVPMTRLRKMMLEELERRNYSPRTIECYIREVEDFANYFHRSPDRLGPQHIREYQAYLFRQRKLSPSSVTQRLAALRFFFIKTLKRSWSVAETPYPKKVQHLPSVLSQEEVTQLINAAPTPFYRILLMTLYATGARRAEVTRLKVSDID